MNLIKDFLKQYQRETGDYEKLAQLCAQQCESGLERMGVRSIVTYRAKRPDRLWQKIRKRAPAKNYASMKDIYADIIDLAGVRIALYFPGDREEVDAFIRSHFVVEETRNFPKESNRSPYPKRFSGYSARHYRIRLKEENLAAKQKEYAFRSVEIQVASVLMHAWAEVEHDLVYKPKTGELSPDEYAILDELNGLIHTGEIALERLQKAVHRRVIGDLKEFSNHYELSAFLYDQVQGKSIDQSDPYMGRADVLYAFLKLIGRGAPWHVETYLPYLDFKDTARSVVEQLVDQILVEDDSLYESYNKARISVSKKDPYGSHDETVSYFSEERALGYFMHRWIAVEVVARKAVGDAMARQEKNMVLPPQAMGEQFFDRETVAKLRDIRRLRNQIIHGMQFPSEKELMEAGGFLQSLLDTVAEKRPELRSTIESALQHRDGS